MLRCWIWGEDLISVVWITDVGFPGFLISLIFLDSWFETWVLVFFVGLVQYGNLRAFLLGFACVFCLLVLLATLGFGFVLLCWLV